MASTSRFHEQVADALRAEIAAGQLAPGDKLPAIRELTERFGYASETIRKALAALADDGLIQPSSTRGYFVTEGAGAAVSGSDSRLEDLARQVADLTKRVSVLESERAGT